MIHARMSTMYVNLSNEPLYSPHPPQNWSKIIWSMFPIMREDPRRRFVIAFTIENTSMRLWFASRSELLASLAFDITRTTQKWTKQRGTNTCGPTRDWRHACSAKTATGAVFSPRKVLLQRR